VKSCPHFSNCTVRNWSNQRRFASSPNSHSSRSSLTIDGQSASLSSYQATIWEPQPIFIWIWNLDNCGWCFWREDGSVIYLYNLQSNFGLSTTSDHLLSRLRLPQHGRSGHSIYIRQRQHGPLISPGTAFLVGTTNGSLGYDGGILSRLPEACYWVFHKTRLIKQVVQQSSIAVHLFAAAYGKRIASRCLVKTVSPRSAIIR
jgi:hypothetical protein